MSVTTLPPVKTDFHDLLRSALALRRLQLEGSTTVMAVSDTFDAARSWFDRRGPTSREAMKAYKAFKHVEIWDDVIALHRKGDLTTIQQLADILDTLTGIRSEAREQRDAVRQARGWITGPLEEEDARFQDTLEAYVATRRWEECVPDGLQPWQRTRQRMARLLLDDDEEKERLRGDLAPSTETKERELAVFTEALEGHSLVALARFDPFDPALAEAVPLDDLRKMQEVIDAATRRAEAIRDLGGTPEEVEAAFGDIPKTWWPPQFIDELQAWRRTRRQIQKEAVLKSRYTENQWFSVKEGVLALKAVLSFAGTMAGNVASVQSNVDKIETGGTDVTAYSGEQFAKDLTSFVSGYVGSLESAASLGEELAGKKPEEWDLEKIHRTLDQTSKTITLLGTTVNQGLALGEAVIKQVTSAADASKSPFAELVSSGGSMSYGEAAKIIPGLGLGIAILKLANAIRALVEQQQWRFKTLGMQDEERGRRTDRDTNWDTWARGGNLERALGNEVDQREHLSSIEALNVTSAAFDVAAGSIGVAKASGLGAPIAAAIEVGILVTKTAVEVAGKVVIANIEFSKMDQARKTLADAQAGSMVAQQLIFLQSAFYAKTYIAILAKDNDPLAARFLIDRGYTGPDLEREDVAVSVLREFLMKHARDKDAHDKDAPQTRLGANTDLIPGGEFLRKTVARKQRYDKAHTKHSKAYDASWTLPSPILLTKDWWDAAKSAAIDAGLVDDSSGIGKGLKAVEKAAAPLKPRSGSKSDLVAAIEGSEAAVGDPLKERAALVGLRTALREANSDVTSWDALTNPPAKDDGEPPGVSPHQGMVAGLASISVTISTLLTTVEAQLEDRTFCDPTWGPTGVVDGDLLKVATWSRVWTQAQDKLALDPPDGGVTAAVTALGSSETALAKAERAVEDFDGTKSATNKAWVKVVQAQRTTRLDALRDLKLLSKALMSIPGAWRAFEAWAVYIDRMREAVATRSRALDKAAAPQDWKPVDERSMDMDRVPDERLLTVAAWTSIHDQGVSAGVVSKDDHGVARLLGAWERVHGAIGRVPPSKPLDRRKLQLDGRRELVKLKDAVSSFADAEKATLPPTYLRYCADVINHANKTGIALRKEMMEVAVVAMTQALTASAWDSFHDRAVEAGVVNKHKLAGGLKDALSDYESKLSEARSKLDGTGPTARKEARVKADEAISKAGKVTGKASDLRGQVADGYGEHPAVTTALDWIIVASGNVAKDNPTLKSLITGALDTTTEGRFKLLADSCAVSQESWSAFSELAYQQGVFDKGGKNAADNAVSDALKALGKLASKPHDEKRFKIYESACRDVLGAHKRLTPSAGFASPSIQRYLDAFQRQLKDDFKRHRETHQEALKEKLSD